MPKTRTKAPAAMPWDGSRSSPPALKTFSTKNLRLAVTSVASDTRTLSDRANRGTPRRRRTIPTSVIHRPLPARCRTASRMTEDSELCARDGRTKGDRPCACAGGRLPPTRPDRRSPHAVGGTSSLSALRLAAAVAAVAQRVFLPVGRIDGRLRSGRSGPHEGPRRG
jgi:hypothetical protein